MTSVRNTELRKMFIEWLVLLESAISTALSQTESSSLKCGTCF